MVLIDLLLLVHPFPCDTTAATTWSNTNKISVALYLIEGCEFPPNFEDFNVFAECLVIVQSLLEKFGGARWFIMA